MKFHWLEIYKINSIFYITEYLFKKKRKKKKLSTENVDMHTYICIYI